MATKCRVSRILVVDDEELARQRVVRFLKEILPEAHVECAEDGVEALEKLGKAPVDLVVLDIQMPGLSGFDVLAQLPCPGVKVVFATAYQEHAIRAFEANACDYLLKPFTKERLAEAVLRASLELEAEESHARLQKSLRKEGLHLTRLALKVGSRTDLVDAVDIECLLAQGDATLLYAGRDEYVSDRSLAWYEEQLSPDMFFRCHRNGIVNLGHVESLKDGEETQACLRSGRKVAVSRRRKADFVERLKKG